MKLKHINLNGFGRLVNRSFEFAPGLNLIYGPNEAGKSTLQRSLLTALYGFYETGKVSRQRQQAAAGYHPWDEQALFELRLQFELDNGQSLEVWRQFAPNISTALVDLESSQDISGQFETSTYGRVYFADELLGMPKEVFENTCFVSQAELATLEGSANAITDTLLRASASATQEASANQADMFLESALKEQIGTARAHTKPMAQTLKKLDSLETERTEAMEAGQELRRRIQETDQARQAYSKMEREHQKHLYLAKLAQRQQLQKQVQAVKEAKDQVEQWKSRLDTAQAWQDFPAHLQVDVNRLQVQQSQLQSETGKARQRASHSIKELPSLYKKMAEINQQIEIAPDLDISSVEAPPNLEIDIDSLPLVRAWLEEQTKRLEANLAVSQAYLKTEEARLAPVLTLDRKTLEGYQKKLHGAQVLLGQAEESIAQAQYNLEKNLAGSQDWQTQAEALSAEVQKWEQWATFPIRLRDEKLRLETKRSNLIEEIQRNSQQVEGSKTTLKKLEQEILETQELSTSLESARSVSLEELPTFRSAERQLDRARQDVDRARQQWEEAQGKLAAGEAALQDMRDLSPAVIQMGVTGLATLQQRWISAQQQVASLKQQFAQAEEAWRRVGMPTAQYVELERTAQGILSGRVLPGENKGCRKILFFWKSPPPADGASPLVKQYQDIQPVFIQWKQSWNEAQAATQSLQQLESEVSTQLGEAVQPSISAEVFTGLSTKMQAYQQASLRLEQQQETAAERKSEFERTQQQYQEIASQTSHSLAQVGFDQSEVHQALEVYFTTCEEKQRLNNIEAGLQNLQNQVQALQREIKTAQRREESLQQIEQEICNLLAQANIQADPENLESGLQEYQQGLENYHHWQESKGQYEKADTRVQPLFQALERAQKQRAQAQADLEQIHQEIGQLLESVSHSEIDENLLGSLLGQQESHRQSVILVKQTGTQVGALRLEAEGILDDIDAWQERETERQEEAQKLLDILQQAGIETSPETLMDGLVQFKEQLQGHSDWMQAKTTYDQAVKNQQSILAGLPQIQETLAAIEKEIEQGLHSHPEWENLQPSEPAQDYEHRAQVLNEKVRQHSESLTRLRQTVENSTQSLRHLAEIDEEIAAKRANLQRLQFFEKALELARRELQAATLEFQKLFAPRLEALMNESLGQVTRDRYNQVSVDPNNLAVSLHSPERGDWVSVQNLSTGTRDLVYLSLRIGIARLMSRSGEKLPLLLDDPLVQYDATRTHQALEYLRSLAEETQVFLFTKDDGTKEWFMGIEGTDDRHRLHEL